MASRRKPTATETSPSPPGRTPHITGTSLFGIEAFSNGRGNISVTTATNDVITSGSVGINVYNQATSIPQTGGVTTSSMSVTAYGTINSGTTYTGQGGRSAGILAGYKGDTTTTVNAAVFGNVIVDNYADINAAGGDGIRAYNFGPGNTTVNDHAGTITAKDFFGITAGNNSTGKVSVTTDAGTSSIRVLPPYRRSVRDRLFRSQQGQPSV